MGLSFYECKTCGNVIIKVVDSGVVPVCCGEEMSLLEENTVDGVFEKHVPDFLEKDGAIVIKIGEVLHPMTSEHHIMGIYLETDKNIYIRKLDPNKDPAVCFRLCEGEKVKNIYGYCNIHGLWCKKCDGSNDMNKKDMNTNSENNKNEEGKNL